jgi:hypothetical protein
MAETVCLALLHINLFEILPVNIFNNKRSKQFQYVVAELQTFCFD